ncbi:MAG: TraR/DksA family transcriptional regulator [Candidatus Dormibacteria bacterium]
MAMGMNLGFAEAGMLLQARQADLAARLDEADRIAPLIDEARRLQHQRHIAALHRVIGQVEAALGKVHDGTYGQCDACGQAIPDRDLAHEPASTLCGSCRGHQAAAS